MGRAVTCYSCRYSIQLKEAEDDVVKDLQAQQLELQQRNMKDRYTITILAYVHQHNS